MVKKTIKLMLLLFWIIISVLYIISLFANLVITEKIIQNFCIFFMIYGFIFLFIKFFRLKKYKNFVLIISVIIIITTQLFINLFSWTGDWKTQTIIYENKYDNYKTIQFQMKNTGALGYKRRIVEIRKINMFLQIVKPVSNKAFDYPWIKVNKDINELNLKYP